MIELIILDMVFFLDKNYKISSKLNTKKYDI